MQNAFPGGSSAIRSTHALRLSIARQAAIVRGPSGLGPRVVLAVIAADGEGLRRLFRGCVLVVCSIHKIHSTPGGAPEHTYAAGLRH